ncbi:MAG: hypothetical protein JO001_17200 [Alphaproteobacteria bacterium]|nr:hypothetical protein [Alphaproteobacteria bacterium]
MSNVMIKQIARYHLCNAVLFALCVLSVPARAGYLFNGNELYKWCSSTAETSQIGCGAYIAGIADGGYLAAATKSPGSRVIANQLRMGQIGPASWCLSSEQITDRQMVGVVIKYLRDNPTHRDMSAAALVALAITQAWPCPAAPTGG